ncbi:MAG TPA: putative quinol monooxygenase [Stellaceae bacterium]|nr:putative quinol monooxygenase [Stellaceae bacterium]
MELFIFARFHARKGQEAALADTLRRQIRFARGEPGCLMIDAYRSTRDPRLFYIHSRWADEAAFEVHADLANTVQFLERVEPLIDRPLDVTRSRPLG